MKKFGMILGSIILASALVACGEKKEEAKTEAAPAAEKLSIGLTAYKFDDNFIALCRKAVEAEAAAKAAILTAEAEGLEKKAEAMAKMNQAAVLEMYFKALPDVAAAIASPLANVDSITMYGEGNSAKMVADITNSLSQVNAGLGETMGLDLRQMLGTLVGAKVVAPTVEQAVADGVDKGLNS